MAVYRSGYNAFTPDSVQDAGITGVRPSVRRVLDLIDTSDPAWPAVAEILREYAAAGVEIDAGLIGVATQVGRKRWSSGEGPGISQQALVSASGAIVYYIRRGDLIKIGTTVEPQKRFRSLVPDEILAVEPGGVEEERARHRQFRFLRVRGEYFRDAPELREHIQQVRDLNGDPDPSWTTTRSVSSRGPRRLPPPRSTRTVTAVEAQSEVGVSNGTFWAWVRRGVLLPVGRDDRGRKLFYYEHVELLWNTRRKRPARYLTAQPCDA